MSIDPLKLIQCRTLVSMETKYTCTGDASTISQYLFWLVKYCILKIIHFDPYSPKIYMTVLGLVLQSFLCLRALECNETIRSSQSEVVLLFRIFLRMVGEYGPWMKPRGQLRGNFTYQSQGNHVQKCTLTLVCTLRYPYPEYRIFNHVISDITILTISDFIETVSQVFRVRIP